MIDKIIKNKKAKKLVLVFIGSLYFIYVLYRFLSLKAVVEDSFVILTVLGWIFVSVVTGQSSKVPITAGIIFLLGIPFLVLKNELLLAQNCAILAFVFLALGIFQQLFSLIRFGGSVNEEKP